MRAEGFRGLQLVVSQPSENLDEVGLPGFALIGGEREAGFAEVKELLVPWEGGIVRLRRKRRRPVAGHQVFHDRNRLDHHDVAVLDRRDEPSGVDGQKLRVFLDAGQ